MKNIVLCAIILSGFGVKTESDWIIPGERDPAWERVHTASARAFTTPSAATTNLNNPLETVNYGDFSSQNSLKDFLDTYTDKLEKDKVITSANQEDDTIIEDDPKKQKNWNFLGIQKHKYPIDDKKEWVSLDPVPWSVSKVAKWKPKPTEASWENFHGNHDHNNWGNDFIDNNHHSSPYNYNKKPATESNNYKVYYISEKNLVVKRPFSRPFTVYDQSVQSTHHKTPIKINGLYNPIDKLEKPRDGIIIDDTPANFPTENFDFNRRTGQEDQTPNHPLLEDGEWVLLSTTKGYKSPRTGQRSLDFIPQTLSTRKSVQLTVLPPLKNSKVNMTTSHGGLLQVESTFESVEQAQKKFQKQQKNKIKKRKRPSSSVKRKKKVVKEVTDSTITTVPRSSDRSAVLAAVGAGMIPATMAMLVPLVNGRKRRKREILTTSDPSSNIEITLPRYF